ncbi:hypothetical protein MESS2_280011 [Mesorhizobium metallidurans STM 2683]|uniref:Uncharacterized protein n=1 Tax=Mesorhizobium metallidurans STM 2683 TaxID=1297569 RepID=M5EN01_9HYPH|nr:hypothetical protein MESS2_280011 [Mesorhizobium metallidurans STM 2683]
MIEQSSKIARELGGRVGRRQVSAPSVTPQVRNDDAMSVREVFDDRLIHYAGDHHAMG